MLSPQLYSRGESHWGVWLRGLNDAYLPSSCRELGTGRRSKHVIFPLPLSMNAPLIGATRRMQRGTEVGRPSEARLEAGAEGWGSGLPSRRETEFSPSVKWA